MSLQKRLHEATARRSQSQERPVLTSDGIIKIFPKVLEIFGHEDKRTVLQKVVSEIIINKDRSHAKIRGCLPIYLEKNQEVELNANYRDSGVTQRW